MEPLEENIGMKGIRREDDKRTYQGIRDNRLMSDHLG